MEFGTVLVGRGMIKPAETINEVNGFPAAADIEVAPVTVEAAREALRARLTFGKGFGSPAGLNYDDRFAYALARQHDAPLLFAGNDFSRTDVKSAL